MDYKLAIRNIDKEIYSLQYSRQEVISEAWPDYEPLFHVVETLWNCPHSPFGFCAYDLLLDPAQDDCLFCHEPLERK